MRHRLRALDARLTVTGMSNSNRSTPKIPPMPSNGWLKNFKPPKPPAPLVRSGKPAVKKLAPVEGPEDQPVRFKGS